MTVQEIHDEVFEDLKTLRNKIEDLKIDFKRIVLKSSRYPLTKSFALKTREKKNLFNVGFTALKRSDWKKPIVNIFGIYTLQEGKYAVVPSIDLNIISIYPPHFFKRYRERILKDESISNEDIIKYYFNNDWGFMGTVVNANFDSVYHCFENVNNEDKISFVAATSQGYCFGEKQGNINIIKTIVCEDMLFENQKVIFTELRIAFQNFNKNRYSKSV